MSSPFRVHALIVALACLLFSCGDSGDLTLTDISSVPTATSPVPPIQPPPSCDGTPLPPVPGWLAWSVPVWPIDCSAIMSVTGYRVYYGTAPGAFIGSIDVGNVTSVALSTLSSAVGIPGTYYLVVTAYDASGLESAYSNMVEKNL